MAKNNNTLVFNGLMQGMSWDLIKEAKDEIKRHLGEKQPTRKDILTDWIIGKDYMLQLLGNSYEGGGSFNLNPNNLGLYALQNGNNNGTNFNAGSSSTDTSTGGSDFINTASQIGGFIGMFDQLGGNIYLGASQNYAGFSNDPYKKAILGDSSKGMLAGLVSRKSELNNALDDINSLVQQFNIGDNASLMSLWNTYIPLKKSTGDAELVDIFGTLVAPGMYNLFGSAKENQEAINLAVKSANARNIANFNTAANNNQLLNTFNQLQHMTKNGGHLALEGKLFKSIKNKIADAMQADLNYSDAPSTNRLNTINKLRGYPTFTFGGGNIGGGGASGYWDEVAKVTPETYWVMNTPLPGRSFSDAFAEAVKNNLGTFWFNNKLYNTKRASSEEEYLKNRTKAEYEEPLNLRTVYDKDWNIYLDSTRIEPYIGQLPIIEKKKSKGGKLKKAHKFAEGGLLNTYDYGLEEVNAGGSHEENPNEGVVVSYAPDGLPNKVEEGETIHNDYVYSKRLEANEKVLENNLLDKKYEGKSFADISKKLTEDRKKRPNDPISVRTNEENLNRLQDALEELKLDNKTREVKRFLGSLNNDLLNALQLEMMEEYEAYAELLAQQLEQEDLAYQEELAALEGMFGRGGHLKQGDVSSSISRLRPVRDAEGNIVKWENPDYNSNEAVLNSLGYNPNYEGALIYADDRNWFERNIASPWNTWWNNLPSPEFSWAVRNLTPVGYVDAAINGDTEALLELALLSGLFRGAKGAVKGFKEAKNASKAEKVAALAKRLEAASVLKGKPKTSNVVEMKLTLPTKGLEEGVSSKTVNMEGKEVTSTEAAKLGSWLRRNWKPVVIVGGGLGLGSWGLSEILKKKNPPYNPLTDPNAYNQFLDEGNTRSNLLQTTNDINTTQHNTGDISGDTLWVGGTPYNINTGEKFEKGGHLFLKKGYIRNQSNNELVFPNGFLTGTSQYDGTYIYRDDDGNYREAYYIIPDVTLDDNDLNMQQYSGSPSSKLPEPRKERNRVSGERTGENPWVTLWKNITSPSTPVVPSQWITENIDSVKHNNRNNNTNTNNNEVSNNEVRLAVSSTPMYTEIPFGFTYDSFALDGSYLESPLYKNMLSYELSKLEEEEEQPEVIRRNRTNVNTTKQTTPNTSLPSSDTTVSEPSSNSTISKPYSNPHIPNYSIFGKYLNNLTPEEIDGNIIGYRNIFGRFVPVGSLPLLTVPSYLVAPSNANTDTDTSKSGGLKPPQEPNKTILESPNYLSYLRYAPILGSLGLVLSDTLGLTNQPDYSNIDMYRRAVDNIGGVNFVPIGGYLQHTPIDREYIANQQLALAAAYNRSLNNANPVGSYILGLINDAKVRDQIGDMYINAAAQDLKDRLAVAEYNRGIDITNARNSLAAQSENARLRALRANEYQKIATMRDNERNTAEAARAANYLGLFTNIGNLGTDEMNRTMVNRNPALFYGVNLDGSIYFKNAFWGLSEDTQNELIDMLEKQGYKISK